MAAHGDSEVEGSVATPNLHLLLSSPGQLAREIVLLRYLALFIVPSPESEVQHITATAVLAPELAMEEEPGPLSEAPAVPPPDWGCHADRPMQSGPGLLNEESHPTQRSKFQWRLHEFREAGPWK
ncbi:unnamed protein product [Calypogeia fissa]